MSLSVFFNNRFHSREILPSLINQSLDAPKTPRQSRFKWFAQGGARMQANQRRDMLRKEQHYADIFNFLQMA